MWLSKLKAHSGRKIMLGWIASYCCKKILATATWKTDAYFLPVSASQSLVSWPIAKGPILRKHCTVGTYRGVNTQWPWNREREILGQHIYVHCQYPPREPAADDSIWWISRTSSGWPHSVRGPLMIAHPTVQGLPGFLEAIGVQILAWDRFSEEERSSGHPNFAFS